MEERPQPVDGAGIEPTVARPQPFGTQPTVARPQPSGTEPTIIPGVPVASDPARAGGRAFGRYVLIDELGHGGMGRVWKAWDSELSRLVALKQILAEGPEDGELVERFMREARLAAKLRHPHVVAVHDVGVFEAQHYFTADYILGRTLDVVIAQGPVPMRQAVGWVKSIAEALSYAHEQGVIHRDVKPGNVLIGQDGHPYVMDFGLAKEVETVTGLTVSGDLLGTPSYMSPEQASGKTQEVGPASDQFSLGGTLYELLSGRRPFAATDMRGVLNAVVERDPVPPTRINPRVHRDLEVICLKALEKAPSRRYASMRDLATDLGRWLEGEPIEARPSGRWERLWRRATRHRWVVLPSAAASLLLLGLLAWVGIRAWGTAKDVREGLLAAQRLEADGDATTDASKREGLWKEAQLRLQWVEARDEGNAEARSAAARIGHRLEQLRAQQDLASRLSILDKAGRVDDVMVRFSELSTDVLWPMESVFFDNRVEAGEKRQRNARLWKEVELFMVETPQDDASQATMWACAGWARRLAGYEDEGIAWMRRAEGIDPEVPYGALLRATVLFSENADRQPLPRILSGGSRGVAFGPAEAETPEMTTSRTELERALEEAEGRLVWGRQEVRLYRAALEAMRFVQRGAYKEATDAISRAIDRRELRPIRSALLLTRARAKYVAWQFDAALVDFEDAKPARQGQTRLWLDMALARIGMAEVRGGRGEDARDDWLGAIEDLGQALLRDPDSSMVYNDRGIAFKGLGDAERGRGLDPRASYGKAIADYGEALRRDPGCNCGFVDRGNAWRCLGEAEHGRGQDPTREYRAAIADFEEALRRDPEGAEGYNNRGVVQLRMGQAEQARGTDPTASLQRAIADFGEALRRNAESEEAYCNRGITHARMAEALRERGQDASESFQNALADYGEALRRYPEFAAAYNNRGIVYVRLAEEEQRRSQDPSESYRKAIAEFGEAVRRNPGYVEAYHHRALASLELGREEQGRGQDPIGSFRKAIADLGEALRLNPGLTEAWLIRGDAYLALGGVAEARGEDPGESYQAAIEDYGQALRRDPELVGAYNNRGTAYLRLGTREKALGRDAGARFRMAIADSNEALRRDPRYWEALANKGLCHEATGEPARAVECYERALAIAGDTYPPLREWLARARAARDR